MKYQIVIPPMLRAGVVAEVVAGVPTEMMMTSFKM